jgi:hypothetical protein
LFTFIILFNISIHLKFLFQYSLDAVLNLTLRNDFYHLLEVQLQTPFDNAPFIVGTYFLNQNIKIDKYFTEPHYKRIGVKEMPYIYDSYWYVFISTNEIIATIISETFSESTFETLYFLLTNTSIQINRHYLHKFTNFKSLIKFCI